MIQTPDRLLGLVQSLEAGNPITPQDVKRVATLQALDLARAGRQFVELAAAREEEHTKLLLEGT